MQLNLNLHLLYLIQHIFIGKADHLICNICGNFENEYTKETNGLKLGTELCFLHQGYTEMVCNDTKYNSCYKEHIGK